MSISAVPKGGVYGSYQQSSMQQYVNTLVSQEVNSALASVMSLFAGRDKAQGIFQSLATVQAVPNAAVPNATTAFVLPITQLSSNGLLLNTNILNDTTASNYLTAASTTFTFPLSYVYNWLTSASQADLQTYLSTTSTAIATFTAYRLRGNVVLFGNHSTATASTTSTTMTYNVLINGSVAGTTTVIYTGASYTIAEINFTGAWVAMAASAPTSAPSSSVYPVFSIQCVQGTLANGGDSINLTSAAALAGSIIQVQLEYGYI